jgi:ABC-type antimicrobial peptide transport system permease subunit
LFEKKVKVVGLFKEGTRDMCGTFIVGDGIYRAFLADHVYPVGLYFNGEDGLDRVLNVATEQGYEKNLAVSDSLGTMSKAVEVFVPVFRLMALVLCAGVIFVLMNFASKTVTEKRHEIGILKALGMKNQTVGFVFVFQVILIAALTVILTCVGYSVFVSTVNEILTESLQSFVSGRVILKLDFISFDSTIMLKNAAFTVILALVSFIIPMIRICRVDPVKIIRIRD